MDRISFVLEALPNHENEQKKKKSEHACKLKNLSFSKQLQKTLKKKRHLLVHAVQCRIKSPWFPPTKGTHGG